MSPFFDPLNLAAGFLASVITIAKEIRFPFWRKQGVFPEMDTRYLSERPYTLRLANASDIDWIYNKSHELFGDEASPRQQRLSWFLKNPNGVMVIEDRSGYVVGSIEVFPVTKHYIENIYLGLIHEKNKAPSDICAAGSPYHCLYIESVIAVDSNNIGNPWVLNEILQKAPSIISRWFPDWREKFIYNQTASTYRSRLGVRKSTSADILEKIGFNKVGRNKLQGLDIYRGLGSEVDRRLTEIIR